MNLIVFLYDYLYFTLIELFLFIVYFFTYRAFIAYNMACYTTKGELDVKAIF